MFEYIKSLQCHEWEKWYGQITGFICLFYFSLETNKGVKFFTMSLCYAILLFKFSLSSNKLDRQI